MIALEVILNGKKICVAGAEDLGVLTARVSAIGKLGSKTVPTRPDESRDFHYSVGGLTSRKDPDDDVHMWWKSVDPLKVGDVIQVKIIETEKADRAKERKKAKPIRQIIAKKRGRAAKNRSKGLRLQSSST